MSDLPLIYQNFRNFFSLLGVLSHNRYAIFGFLSQFCRCERYKSMIAVNCTAMTEMCAIVLPKMIARNRGVVMNISSASARGMLIHPTYSATKAFVSVLSDCLNRTYSGKGSGKVKKKFHMTKEF